MSEPPGVQTIKTQFKRSKLCRVIHVDGVYGTLTPQLNVHMAIYSEHRAFPEGTTVRVDPQGTVQETPTADPGVFIREIEADIILTEGSAVALRDWLSAQINVLQAYHTESAAQKEE